MFFLSRKIKNWSLNYCFWNEIMPCLYLLCWDMLVKIDKNNKETRIAVISLQISNISFVILQTFFISQLFVNVFTFLHKKGLCTDIFNILSIIERYGQFKTVSFELFVWSVRITDISSLLLNQNWLLSLYKWCGFLLQTQWRKF